MSRVRLLPLVAAAFLAAAPALGADAPAPRPAPARTADHVVLESGGKRLSGWTLAPATSRGYALLADDGRVALLPREPKAIRTVARPVTDVPTEPLVGGLAHGEKAVRERCAQLLRDQGGPAVAPLGPALESASPDARRLALGVLATLAPAHPKAARPWVARVRERVLRDADERVREAALECYVALGPDDVREACEDALEFDDAPRVRHEAIVQLGRLGDLRSVDRLLLHLEGCEQRDLRLVTFDALRRITGKSFGREETRWRNWWGNHRRELLPPDAF